MSSLITDRLVLRRWEETDRTALHAMNSDPVVMATLGPVMTREQSDAAMDRWDALFDDQGFGWWCVDLGGDCIGFTGLAIPWFRDGIEIGWRLRSEHWGRGYATEAANAVLAAAFGPLGLEEVISFTAATNHRSRRVMERIGLRRDVDGDFDHPSAPEALRPHVLYRLSVDEYRAVT